MLQKTLKIRPPCLGNISKIWTYLFWPSGHRFLKSIDIWKPLSGARAEIENTKKMQLDVGVSPPAFIKQHVSSKLQMQNWIRQVL